MKKYLTVVFFSLVAFAASAQTEIKYGYLSYDSLMYAMPEYAEMKSQMENLRRKYEAEALYNETSFRRMFAEFLQGQKDFPQNILLKRQRDLQEAMEKGLAFRRSADSLLVRAEADMRHPIRERLDRAIAEVGRERGYECVVNTDTGTFPFLHPSVSENAAPFVIEKLNAVKP